MTAHRSKSIDPSRMRHRVRIMTAGAAGVAALASGVLTFAIAAPAAASHPSATSNVDPAPGTGSVEDPTSRVRPTSTAAPDPAATARPDTAAATPQQTRAPAAAPTPPPVPAPTVTRAAPAPAPTQILRPPTQAPAVGRGNTSAGSGGS